jgi:hypothetical protein
MSDPMAVDQIRRLDMSETLMREVIGSHIVNHLWPDTVPALLDALDALARARVHLKVHAEIKDNQGENK